LGPLKDFEKKEEKRRGGRERKKKKKKKKVANRPLNTVLDAKP